MAKEKQSDGTSPKAKLVSQSLDEGRAKGEDKEKKSKKSEDKKEKIDRTFPDIQPGCVVKIHQKIKDTDAKGKEKERIQIFEGLVIGRKHGKEAGATITVRKISKNIGVEKIFPLALPQITKIEVIKKYRSRRTKLYFTRNYKKKLKEVKKTKKN